MGCGSVLAFHEKFRGKVKSCVDRWLVLDVHEGDTGKDSCLAGERSRILLTQRLGKEWPRLEVNFDIIEVDSSRIVALGVSWVRHVGC